jgi:hypothetical protein
MIKLLTTIVNKKYDLASGHGVIMTGPVGPPPYLSLRGRKL